MLQKIKTLAGNYKDEIIEIRHHIHAHPELSYQEFKTAALIHSKLASFGIPCKTVATTGVVGIIEGKNPTSKIVALRADMDALPIEEKNDISYRSINQGIMHACGHDVHTSCLIGAAKILQETRADWEGSIKLIFQPGEEKNPGGASLMIKEGVLENPAPQKIFGMHVHPGLPVGKFSFRGGMVMASADEIYITIRAKGGHAAAPQLTADTILIASHLVVSLQQIVSRNNNPFNPTVLSITSIQGGNATNIIPSEVKLMGTLRAMNEDWRFAAHDLIRKQCKGLVESMGATCEVNIDIGYPFVYNNPDLSTLAMNKARDFAGDENVEQTELRMGAEDFAFYSHKIPGCFFRLGVGNIEKGITSNVHTPTFNIDESAIEKGMAMMAWLAVSC
ncbi:MAG: amidohydrolase [Chitinophagaceae bacterium]|nr:amidohydrolase [Chitinophagaceae bacterium]